MKGRALLVLPLILFAVQCTDNQSPTGLSKAPVDPSEIISDGAHGGNPDFFFLPPMVPLPYAHPDFELGEFNDALQPSLRIEICELQMVSLNAGGRPTNATPCVAGTPLKTFPAGTVNLVKLPLKQWGWWSLFNLPDDGFYYVLWNTRQSNLDVNKYYRIKVLINGSSEPLGIADVDPMSSLRQWKHTLTGEVVQMVDDTYLPIPFRVEKSALCGGEDLCGSATLGNVAPDGSGSQVLRVVDENGEAVAGVKVPDGWLPADGPQNVVFTITAVNTGTSNLEDGTQQTPCHANLPLQQFDGCFHFSTIPELQSDETGKQFAKSIIGAVCFELHDTNDPREEFVQLWSSEPEDDDDTPKALESADATGILTHGGEDCTSEEVIARAGSSRLTQFANAGWRKMKGGVGRFFGVKTAYAVDLGLGGILDGLSNIGPALSADIQAYSATTITTTPGGTATPVVRVLGTRSHSGGSRTTGLNGVAVTFTVGANGGTLNAVGSTAPATTQVKVKTGAMSVGEGTENGLAPVTWTLPTTPGTYTLSATGQALGDPVVYTATVTNPVPNPVLTFTGTESYSVEGTNFVRYRLGVSNYTAYPAEMFAPAPTLPPCGSNTNSSRTWVDIYNASNNAYIYGFCGLGDPASLNLIWFALPVGTAPPAQVYIKLFDRATGLVYTSNSVAPVLPNLVITSGTPVLTPTQLTTAGGVVTLSATTISNTGGPFSLANGVRFGVYLSTDAIITPADRNIGSANITPGALESGGTVTLPMPVGNILTSLGPVTAGNYFIGFLVDDNNLVSESNEGNNYVSAPFSIVAPLPDLVISSGPPTVTSSTVLSGGEISVSTSMLHNAGGAVPSGDTWVGVALYLSTDPIITRVGDWRFGANAVPPSTLVAGASVGFGWTNVGFGRIPAGTYYLGVMADIDNVVAESNEDNNSVVSSTTVTVVWPGLSVLNGDWRDENSGSTARLLIGVDGDAVSVQAWGDCTPTGCPWGTAQAQTNLWATEQKVVAVFQTEIAVRTVTLQRLSSRRLAASMHFNYHDSTPDQTINRLFQLTP